MAQTLIQLFARPPIRGRVKTRLIPDIGADKSLLVYRHCLHHNLQLVRSSGFDYQIWLSESSSQSGFNNEALHIQQGETLGDRMLHAMSSVLSGPGACCRNAILIGSDCLDLTLAHLQRVDACLQRHELVIIPADDGGYVLIAAKDHIHPVLFDGIPWGTDQVMKLTRQRIMQAGVDACIPDPLRDIDRYADLQHYAELHCYL